MTFFPDLVQPFLNIANTITNILYSVVPLCIGVSAALSYRAFLFAAILVGLFMTVFSKIANFPSNISNLFNSAFIFLIVGYFAGIGLKKLALNHWSGY